MGVLNFAILSENLTAAVAILSFSYTVTRIHILCLISVEKSISSCSPHYLAMALGILPSQLLTTICGKPCRGRSPIIHVSTLNLGGTPLIFSSPRDIPVTRFGGTVMKVLVGRVFKSGAYVVMTGTPFLIRNLGDTSAKPVFNCQLVTTSQSNRMMI